FSCLQKAGFDEAAFHESGGGGAVLLAKYDPDVRMGQLVAATVLLDVLAGVDLAPARIERDEMAEDAKDDPTAAPQARIMAMALKAGAGVADVRTYRDIAERAGAIAAAAYGFTAAGPGHWRAPDGLVVSVSPSSRDFGWQVVPGSDGEEYQRRFGDLRKDAEADDAGRAARKMATGGE
ncbi:MAG: hypothetical protein JO255_21070, partial [Alphaproteobacteria bacterium]|nr:hypothetical protein [Alphaproteobacteria bacterium]